MFRKLKNIKQALINAYEIKNIIKINNNFVINELEYKTIINNLKYKILTSKEIGIATEKYFENDVIVSLTSYGKRIYDVCLTIESLMEQTLKPNKIILWLAENEFSDKTIPESLKILQKKGLTIDYCEDIKSYKKLIPTLINYPNDIIITVDDDIIFQFDIIENLINSYKQNSDIIHFGRGHRMKFKIDGNLENYKKWDFCISNMEINKLNFPTGGGGCLYPPNCFHKDITNKEIFMKFCPTADDVWFKTMSLLNGMLSKKVLTHNPNGEDYFYLHDYIQNETALWNINKTKNDEQIKAVFQKYNIYELLKVK